MVRLAVQQEQPEVVDLGGGRRVRLHDRLGRGTCATVFRATYELPSGLRHPVAVKAFDAMSSDEAESIVAGLGVVASRLACVRHPNVVRVVDVGVALSRPMLVLELVDGVSLRALLERYRERKARVPLDLALFVVAEILEGLSGARTASDRDGLQLGVHHLGLTSGEVLLSFLGEVKVSDFELQTVRAGASSVRSLGAVADRAVTMAPEIAQGERGDARADVFAAGVLMRELLVGPRFPDGIGSGEAIRLAREGYVQPISFQPNLTDSLVSIIRRALAIDPEHRYPNASAMAFEVRRIALGMGVGDARWFLRRALEREFKTDGEVTAEVPSGQVELLPVAELPLPPRRRPFDPGEDDDTIVCLASDVFELARDDD